MPSDKKFSDMPPSMKDSKYILKILKTAVIGVIIFMLLWGSFFVVGPGEKGVIFNSFTGIRDKTFDEGLHFKLPLFETHYRFEVRTRIFRDQASAASKDLQVVSTEIALNYHIEKDKVNTLFKNIGSNYEERIIDPSIQEVVKAITAKHIAEELITKREVIKEEIKVNLRERLVKSYIILDDLSLTDFDFSEEFNRAIESKVTAEQLALKAQRDLERIKTEALQNIEKAKGESEAIRIINEQLLKSPQYINYLTIQKWDGKMPLALGSGSLLSITGEQK
ncbi:prohibitin family protein [Candidatus Woesearchaeota archaeon]|nr:prohibitin family protein [Candidatus Woesearchaeota archaeon]